MGFVIRLPQSRDQRGDDYDLILVIVNYLMTIVNYKPVQTTITILTLTEVILNIVIPYYGLLDSIVSNYDSVFMFKFWSFFYYLLSIKHRLSTTFHFQNDGQTEQQKSTNKAYFRVFINYKKDKLAKLLPIVEFAYNNSKYSSKEYMLFELNYGYYLYISY